MTFSRINPVTVIYSRNGMRRSTYTDVNMTAWGGFAAAATCVLARADSAPAAAKVFA